MGVGRASVRTRVMAPSVSWSGRGLGVRDGANAAGIGADFGNGPRRYALRLSGMPAVPKR